MNFNIPESCVNPFLLLVPEYWWLMLMKKVRMIMGHQRGKGLVEMIQMQDPNLLLLE
jgi:hypothetical protein